MSKILVTGGLGFIGSHTLIDLVENGFDVISVDNFSNSTQFAQDGIEKILGKPLTNYNVDLKNYEKTRQIFINNTDIAGIIHFAAYKAVGESVEEPLSYYDNNISSLINLLKCVDEFKVKYFVFSSSCTVYGSPDAMPVNELHPIKPTESPYGATKQMGERILQDVISKIDCHTVLLRYFNPVGAHPSAHIGELPLGKPLNLIPVITQTAVGKYPQMQVYGNDYDTRDGSCIRDYIHVCDVASAHTLALQYLMNNKQESKADVFNLGSGNGVTVLEAINAFEQVSNIKLNYKISERRKGDIAAIYADNTKAINQLNWVIKYSLQDMMQTAWDWQQKIMEYEKQMVSK